MIKLNGKRVEISSYTDGTLDLIQADPHSENDPIIGWWYENDSELFALYSLKQHLQRFGYDKVHLFMPYIPNARMDRVKRPEDVFTLKYFAEFINFMSFASVTVLDPHSTVSEALIENIQIIRPGSYIKEAIRRINSSNLLMFYPDEGAMKRYSGAVNIPYAFGFKRRDWQTREILELEIMGAKDLIKGSDILIADDICAKGDTALYTAKTLKAHGAEKVYLFVTHCENTISKNEVLTTGLIEQVYTTDSICTTQHERLEVFHI